MTFKELQDEVIALRFNENDRERIKRWINLRYAALWTKADWSFTHVKGASLAVTGGDATPTMPSDFEKSEGVFDDDGAALYYLEPDEWRNIYLDPTVTANTPTTYTVIDSEIWFGPTPSASATFTLSYRRRLAHISGATGLTTAGVMVADTDEPDWNAEYDYLLAIDATILGQQLQGDPTYVMLVPQRDELLADMKRRLIDETETGMIRQWGDYWSPGIC